MTKNVISGLIYSDPRSHLWLLSAVYGPPHNSDRDAFWNKLGSVTSMFNGPWLLIGDFNGTLFSYDRLGGNHIGSSSSSAAFRFNVHDLGLIPLPQHGAHFTWDNRHSVMGNIRAKLDQALANDQWLSLFQNASLKALPACSSDHCPLILNTMGVGNFLKHPFRFEAMWTRDPRSTLIVKHAWSELYPFPPAVTLCRKIAKTRIALTNWNKTKQNMAAIRSAIADLQNSARTPENMEKEKNLRWALTEQLIREEIHWKQSSRVKRIQEGDGCTKFFFVSTITRRRRNSIEFIKDSQGNWLNSRQTIGSALMQKFKETYCPASFHPCPDLGELITPVISTQENSILCAIPDDNEIREALFTMGSLKAPGPDGMSVLFYKHYWSIVGLDLISTVRNFFLTAHMNPSINTTNLVLIPKKPTSHFY